MAQIGDQPVGNIHTGMGDIAQAGGERHRRLGHAIARGQMIAVGVGQGVVLAL